MSLQHIIHDIISDKVNVANAIGASSLIMIKTYSSMHEISTFAQDISHIVGAFSVLFLFGYNVVKFFKELKNK